MREANDAELCPCGAALAGPRGTHVLCTRHRKQVERDVTRRFGLHRYGGRHAHEIEDIVHACYEKLLGKGGIDRFEPPFGRTRADAFGGWLWSVVTNHCHNWRKTSARRPSGSLKGAREPQHSLTPHQAFARHAVLEHASSAVAAVEAAWKAEGAKKSERFDAFIGPVLGEAGSYKDLAELLELSVGNAHKIGSDLAKAVRLELRRRIRDTLSFEPGLRREAIERRIDEEIEELLTTAFPAECEPLEAQPTSELDVEKSESGK